MQKALLLLEAIADSRGTETLQSLAAHQAVPLPTAWRMVKTLIDCGFLQRGSRGYYLPGQRLRKLAETVTETDALASLARPVLRNLAKKFQCVAHLGSLSDDMVTYLVREETDVSKDRSKIPTREGTQLEAYCSAIGKVLLSERDTSEIQAYLQAGEFIALTENTITDPEKLNEELERIAQCGFAIDAREVQDDLTCIALPLRPVSGKAIVAISLSQAPDAPSPAKQKYMLRHLKQAADSIIALTGQM